MVENVAHNMKPQPQTIDVHRLKVPEAIEKVEQALYDAIVTSTPELRIITGQGKHSKNKIPALKLAIIGAMAEYVLLILLHCFAIDVRLFQLPYRCGAGLHQPRRAPHPPTRDPPDVVGTLISSEIYLCILAWFRMLRSVMYRIV